MARRSLMFLPSWTIADHQYNRTRTASNLPSHRSQMPRSVGPYLIDRPKWMTCRRYVPCGYGASRAKIPRTTQLSSRVGGLHGDPPLQAAGEQATMGRRWQRRLRALRTLLASGPQEEKRESTLDRVQHVQIPRAFRVVLH